MIKQVFTQHTLHHVNDTGQSTAACMGGGGNGRDNDQYVKRFRKKGQQGLK